VPIYGASLSVLLFPRLYAAFQGYSRLIPELLGLALPYRSLRRIIGRIEFWWVSKRTRKGGTSILPIQLLTTYHWSRPVYEEICIVREPHPRELVEFHESGGRAKCALSRALVIRKETEWTKSRNKGETVFTRKIKKGNFKTKVKSALSVSFSLFCSSYFFFRSEYLFFDVEKESLQRILTTLDLTYRGLALLLRVGKGHRCMHWPRALVHWGAFIGQWVQCILGLLSQIVRFKQERKNDCKGILRKLRPLRHEEETQGSM